MEFEWDQTKAEQNRRKHNGVTFEEGASVFQDLSAWVSDDVEHSAKEIRYKLIGFSSKARLLAVSLTRRGNAIRIISARKATATEEQGYGKNKSPLR